MKNYLYVLYNKLSARYESVVTYPSDAFAVNQAFKMKVPEDEYDICRVGSIDIESGIITPEAPIRLIFSTAEKLPTTSAD